MPNAVVQVGVSVSDLERAVAFYQDALGLELIGRFPPGLVFLRAGSTRIMLSEGSGSVTVYYGVDDIDNYCAGLRQRGVTLTSEPHMIFRDDAGLFGAPGTEDWMAFCEDPDGNPVGLVERRAP